MRVVLVSPNLPLPFGRADARWLSVVASELARRSVDVTCIACADEPEEAADEAVRLAERNGFALRVVRRALSEPRPRRWREAALRPKSELARVADLRTALAEELRPGYDVLHVEHLFTSWVGDGLPKRVVYLHHLELVDEEHRPDLSLRERRTLVQLRRATRRLLNRAPRLIVASSRLQAEVARFRYGDTVPVVPVALDPALYDVVDFVEEPVVGVIGSMHWYPSRSAAERVLTQVWDRVTATCPDARLLVAGWNADRYLGRFFPRPGARLLGTVDHPRDFFSQVCLLLYAPPRGSGMKIKVLEAMAYGVPVVANQEGVEGLDIAETPPVETAETDDDLVRNTVGLLRDPARRSELRRSARRFLEANLSPVPAVDRLLEAYGRLGLTA